MCRLVIAACLALASSNAFAAWKVETGKKALSSFPPLTGTLATAPAKSAYKGVIARLQLECFTHPQLTGIQFGIVLSKAPPNGFMAWRYQYDSKPPVQTKPYSRSLPPESISLAMLQALKLRGSQMQEP